MIGWSFSLFLFGVKTLKFPCLLILAEWSKNTVPHVWDSCFIPSQSLTWNLKMIVSNRNLLFQGLIFRFHVKLQGCNQFTNGLNEFPCRGNSTKSGFFRWIQWETNLRKNTPEKMDTLMVWKRWLLLNMAHFVSICNFWGVLWGEKPLKYHTKIKNSWIFQSSPIRNYH